MTEGRLDSIEQILRQLVAGQEASTIRFDAMGGRFDAIDRRLDKLEIGQETLSDKVQQLAETQVLAQENMTQGFEDLREQFDRRLGPLETAVRGLYGATPE